MNAEENEEQKDWVWISEEQILAMIALLKREENLGLNSTSIDKAFDAGGLCLN